MYDESEILSRERSHVGQHGAFLVVENVEHSALCAKAIRRRTQPGWSRYDCGHRVSA